MSNVIPFSRLRDHSEEDRRRQLNEQRLRETEDAGSHAWAKLKARKGKRLLPEDRLALAKALNAEFEALRQRSPGFRVGRFAVDSGLSAADTSRELHRLTLPSDDHTRAKRSRDLRVYADKYIRFVEAIQRKTKENMALLADRVTWATSFHPRQAKDVEESERLLDTLQEAINRIDRSFTEFAGGKTLFEVFQQTASLKVEGTKQGSLMRWPYFDAEVPFADLTADEFPQVSSYSRRRDDEIETRYAYWARDYEEYQGTGHCGYPSWLGLDETITHLPRIYLGLIVDWNSESYPGVADASRKARERTDYQRRVGEIQEEREESTGIVTLIYRHPESGEVTRSLCNPILDDHHAWLLIYPSPDNRSLVPVIYQLSFFFGPILIPLTHRNFLQLKNFEYISRAEPISLYERIKQLIGYGTGQFEIADAWKATAPDVLSNPILRAHRDKEKAEQQFACLLDNWWNGEQGGT